MTLPRTVSPETLDHLPEDDPAAMRSRRDLRRVHLAMGTRGILLDGLRELQPARSRAEPLRVLELGAGDGTLMLRTARALQDQWPPVSLTLLDRQRLVTPATVHAYAALGWQASVQVQDVMHWAADIRATTGRASSAEPAAGWDLIVTSLFLHHFEGQALTDLLEAAGLVTDRFFACEPRRAWAALAGSHLIGAIGANAVTREDAVLSVHAGFRDRELSAAWPGQGTQWSLHEYPARLFSHCFSARRQDRVRTAALDTAATQDAAR